MGRPRPGQGGQAEGSLGGIQKGPCGSGGEAEPGDGWAPHGTGRLRRLPWMGSGRPGPAARQAKPCMHTLTWAQSPPRSPPGLPLKKGELLGQEHWVGRKASPTLSPSAASGLVLRLTQAQLSVSPGHRTTLRTPGFSFRPTRPPHPFCPCPENPLCLGTAPSWRAAAPGTPSMSGLRWRPAHIHSPAAFLPTLPHDGGWEPGIGGGSNHTVEAGKHCRSGLFFSFPGKLVVNHSAAYHCS